MIGVVDTSVVLKWYVNESDTALARPLLGLELAAPDIILVELANALWKKVRNREIESSQPNDAVFHLAESVKLVSSPVLVEQALALALELSHPVYDCLFPVLAKELGVPLISSDERLCRRVEGTEFASLMVPLRSWRME